MECHHTTSLANSFGGCSTTENAMLVATRALRVRAGLLLLVLGIAGAGLWAKWMYDVYATPAVDFNLEVRPILNRSCISCHGGVKQAGGFSVLFREEAMRPAKSGRQPIVPGSPARSELIRRVTLPASDPDHMPQRGVALGEQEIRILRTWVKQGAKWQDHWAYVAPKLESIPQPHDRQWVLNPVDAFVRARLERHGLQPSPRAECAQLLRRVTLDLVGLPTTYEDTQRFCAGPSQQAYAREVDRLLASPRFGERWASMWLDLARYADSTGYEDDKDRVIWEYRDWVIRAFNRDLPFDEFTIEQLAGDLLPQPSFEQLLATAYHRNAPARNDEEEFRIEAIIDRVSNTWEVWQGQTLGCARCHSHTYDPFRQTDFYKLFAFFNNTEDADRKGMRKSEGLPPTQAYEPPMLHDFPAKVAEQGAKLVAERDALRAAMLDVSDRADIAASRQEWEEGHRRYKAAHPSADGMFEGVETGYDMRDVEKIVVRSEDERTPNDRRRLADFYAEEVAPQLAVQRKRVKALTKQILALGPVLTPIMRERPRNIARPTHLLIRGGWRAPDLQQPMQPNVPDSMPPLMGTGPFTRLDLARWLVDPRNPLTARVTVNRFWAELFGTGIVPSTGNFGTQGERPVDPALLDWLAITFRTNMKWSMKTLLRTLVLSATYQQTSAATPAQYAADPYNHWLTRGPRVRLSAEAVRDQALAVAGLLSEKQFGPPVRFPTTAEMPHGLTGSVYVESQGEDRYRRAIYGFVRRSGTYPGFEVFDHPTRLVATSQRGRSNTPLQALTTLNDPVFVEASDTLARQMATAAASPAEQIAWAYRRLMARNPTPAELEQLLALHTKSGSDLELARRLVCNVMMNLDAALTKE
jgi:hypothetical protein